MVLHTLIVLMKDFVSHSKKETLSYLKNVIFSELLKITSVFQYLNTHLLTYTSRSHIQKYGEIPEMHTGASLY